MSSNDGRSSGSCAQHLSMRSLVKSVTVSGIVPVVVLAGDMCDKIIHIECIECEVACRDFIEHYSKGEDVSFVCVHSVLSVSFG